MKNLLNAFKTLLVVILATTIMPGILSADWELQTNGLPGYTGSVWAMDACDPMNAIFADIPLQIYKTTNRGELWNSSTITGVDSLTHIIDISMVDPDHIWVAAYSPPSIYATTDGGLNWSLQFSDSNIDRWINYIEMFDTQNGVAMLDGDQSTDEPALFLTTSDGGKNWVAHQQAGMPSYSYNLWHAIDFVNPSVGYFYKSVDGSSHVWKTTDGCNSWTLLESISESVSFPVVKFYDENIGVLAGMKNIWTTTDGGESWLVKAKPESVVSDVEFVPGGPNRIWLSNYRDLLFTANGGASWDTVFSIYPGELADMVVVDGENAWLMGTVGVYHTNVNAGWVSIEQKVNTPQGYAITKVYPNPFNPSTTIQYEVSQQTMVKLTVFDIQGQEVITLQEAVRPAGNYEVQWHGVDRTGSQVSTGMYFARLQSGAPHSDGVQYSSVVKMIHLK